MNRKKIEVSMLVAVFVLAVLALVNNPDRSIEEAEMGPSPANQKEVVSRWKEMTTEEMFGWTEESGNAAKDPVRMVCAEKRVRRP